MDNTKAMVHPKDIRDLIDSSDIAKTNPRQCKHSYFIGGEHAIPTVAKRRPFLFGRKVYEKENRPEQQVKISCKKLIKCDISDVYWWVVYNHIDSNGISVFSLIEHSPLARFSEQYGVIVIKKSDTERLSIDAISEMLEKELSEYSVWVNSNQLCEAM